MRCALAILLGTLAAGAAAPASAQTFASMSYGSSSCSGGHWNRSCEFSHYGSFWRNPQGHARTFAFEPRRWDVRWQERHGRDAVRPVVSRTSRFEIVNP
jgi:hypothetical protein